MKVWTDFLYFNTDDELTNIANNFVDKLMSPKNGSIVLLLLLFFWPIYAANLFNWSFLSQ